MFKLGLQCYPNCFFFRIEKIPSNPFVKFYTERLSFSHCIRKLTTGEPFPHCARRNLMYYLGSPKCPRRGKKVKILLKTDAKRQRRDKDQIRNKNRSKSVSGFVCDCVCGGANLRRLVYVKWGI